MRLNRRMAPSTYLGVAAIVEGGDGRLAIRPAGETVGEVLEWAVEMRRLPTAGMLASRLAHGRIDNAPLNEVVALLVNFHDAAATGPGVDEYGTPAAIAANARDNLATLADFVRAAAGEADPARPAFLPAELHAFLVERTEARLAAHHATFLERVRTGRIRDGHGDLHAENLCFTSGGVVAYDCIEFAPAFRCGDVACDLAFLAMDLDLRGYPGFSAYLVHRYARLSGDQGLAPLMLFYKGYRALVRAKVAALTGLDPALDAEQRDAERQKALRYLLLAVAYELPPTLILMCGEASAGKSWLARKLAGSLRAAVLHEGVRRQPLASAPDSGDEDPERWASAEPEVDRERFRDAQAFLRGGHSVLIDDRFARRDRRGPWVDAAERLGLPYFVVHVVASPDTLASRRKRLPRGAPGDGAVQSVFEPPVEVPPERLIEFRSECDAPEESAARVLERLIRLRGQSPPDPG